MKFKKIKKTFPPRSLQQRGFILLSVIFAAVIIGIIALYEARLTQAEAQAQQVQRTAERMHLWLESALAYYYANENWPMALDFQRITPLPANTDASLSFYRGIDLVAAKLMISATEDYLASTTSGKFGIAESPADTAWALPSANIKDNYLIMIRAPDDPDDPAKAGQPNQNCYTTFYPTEPKFRHYCEPQDPFTIMAYVPSELIAKQIAAKLPMSKVEKDTINPLRWIVYASVTSSNVQSSSSVPGTGSFISGFLPMVRMIDHSEMIPHPPFTASSGVYVLDNVSKLDNQKNGWNQLRSDNHLGVGANYTYGTTAYSYLGGDYAAALYGETQLSSPTDRRQSNFFYTSDSLAIARIPTGDVPFTFPNSWNAPHSYFGCTDFSQNQAPNLVVSTPGFSAPPMLKYQMYNQYSNKYLQSGYPSGWKDKNSAPDTAQYLGMCDSASGSCSTSNGNIRVAPFLPYSSLYALIVMSFEAQLVNNHYNSFLIEAMGMSNQARGVNSINPTYTYSAALQDYDVNDVRNSNRDTFKQTTSGAFPGNVSSNDGTSIAEVEHDGGGTTGNTDHFWSMPQVYNDSVSGIDGVNFFLYCNGKY
ncbi:MAG: hypothetical protein K0R12_1110 [Gammaproteobacteria bacterium]|jgi:type II secretory pathway pseudopilin PulG|nr:hypothetical protein [Gammaproteobacteria bacterium]